MNSGGLLPHEIKRRAAAWCAAFGNPMVTPSDKAASAAVPCAGGAVDLGVSSLNSAQVGSSTWAAFSRAARPGEVCVVSYEEARDWAAANGLCRRRQAMDLRAVNKARKSQGLAPFALKGEG